MDGWFYAPPGFAVVVGPVEAPAGPQDLCWRGGVGGPAESIHAAMQSRNRQSKSIDGLIMDRSIGLGYQSTALGHMPTPHPISSHPSPTSIQPDRLPVGPHGEHAWRHPDCYACDTAASLLAAALLRPALRSGSVLARHVRVRVSPSASGQSETQEGPPPRTMLAATRSPC